MGPMRSSSLIPRRERPPVTLERRFSRVHTGKLESVGWYPLSTHMKACSK